MDYIGSKAKLDDWIFDKIDKNISGIKDKELFFLDACSGSGYISRFAMNYGMSVISNDLMKFSSYLVNGCVKLSPDFDQEIDYHITKINAFSGVDGFFYKNFSESGNRLYFTDDNAKKIDECRRYLDKIENEKIKNYLMYCAIEALSRVSNTTGVQAAYLKKFKDRAKLKFQLRREKIIESNFIPKTYNEDIVVLLKNDSYRKKYNENIIYIDPPYNGRQYGPNYHLYETFVRYDNPKLIGKTGLRKDWKEESKSDFCSKKKFLNILREIYENSTAEYFYLSYSSDGIIKIDEIGDYLNEIGIKDFSTHSRLTKRYKSDISEDRKYNNSYLREYLIEFNK